jgi:hypothetical protein
MKSRPALLFGLGLLCCFFLLGYPGRAGASDCDPSVGVEPASAGLSQIVITAPCLAKKKVRLRYDALELVRVLDESGRLSMQFDCYLGEKPRLTVVFPDGSSTAVALQTLDLDRVTKVAVIWKGAANLDLHAFEYAASSAEEGHVWAAAASSRWQAEERKRRDKRGHGFLSFASDGSAEGDQLEVYTFVHEAGQKSGAVTLALDYESRARLPRDPDTCGTGLYAEIEYRVAVWRPNGHISHSRGVFAPLECNQPGDQIARYSSKALPQLILTR